MEEKPFLKSQISIVYLFTLFLFLGILIGICIPCFRSNDWRFYLIAAGLILLYVYYLLDFLITMKRLLFFDNYLLLVFPITGKRYQINYEELKSMETEHQHYSSDLPAMSTLQSENDVITLKTESGLSFRLQEYRYDNFFQMQSTLRKIIRGEEY